MSGKYIGMVHDKSWKYAFRNVQIFHDFIYSYFNKGLARSIVPGSIERIDSEHIPKDDPKRSVSDIIYKTACTVNDSVQKPIDVYFIIEFQSTVDSDMPGRIYTYAHHLSEDLSSLGDAKTDYRIITLVIYTRRSAPMTNSDPRALDFQSYFHSGNRISPYYQINISNFSNDELISAGGVISAIMYIENLGTIEEYTEETIAILKDIIQDENPEKKERFYGWILKRFDGKITRDETKKLFQDNPEEVKRMLVDLLDDPWRAGVEQGQAENQREIALNMLKDGLSIDRIRKYTKLSDDEIQAFQKNGHENSRENGKA